MKEKDIGIQKVKSNPKGLEKHFEILDKANEKEYAWIKQVLITVSALMGLIISLKSETSKSDLEHIVFVVTIVSSGLCILCGLIFLYGNTDTTHSLANKHAEHLESQNDYENTLIQVAPKKIFGILRVCFFILLFSTVISLMFYAILSDIPSVK